MQIAFDGDAVLFSEGAEWVYQKQGFVAFCDHKRDRVDQPLPAGPFAKLLHTLSTIQQQAPPDQSPMRSSPAYERVIKTLRAWGLLRMQGCRRLGRTFSAMTRRRISDWPLRQA